MANANGDKAFGWFAGTFSAWAIIFVVLGGMWGYPQWNVYHSRLQGEAELSRAESKHQIAVRSAFTLAQAEIERAKGVAEANRLIGQSLHDNENYLRYLWIQSLRNMEARGTVIYVPTEGNLPILEAQRLKK